MKIIIALAVVGALKGQLKQAAQQSAAGGYVREGSFRLDVNCLLYTSRSQLVWQSLRWILQCWRYCFPVCREARPLPRFHGRQPHCP